MCLKSSRWKVIQTWIIRTFIVFFIYDASVCGTIWRETTACYGADRACSSYQLTCAVGETIVLGELKYGTKLTKPRCQFGVSNCKQLETDCCSYNHTDLFTDFSVGNETTVRRNCEGRSSCSGWAPRLFTSPYSSYIWIKYACVKDKKSIANMCTSNSITGHELFLANPQFYVTSDTNSSVDCSCRVTPTVCGTTIKLTVVHLDFNRPGTNGSNCSNAYLVDSGVGKTIGCLTAIGMKQIMETQIMRRGDVVSIRNVFKDNYKDRPKSILFYYSSEATMSLECFSPGVETYLVDNCTTAPVTTDTISGENSSPTLTASRGISTGAPSHTREATLTTPTSTFTMAPSSAPVQTSTVTVSTSSSKGLSTKTSDSTTALPTSYFPSSKARDTSLPTIQSTTHMVSTTRSSEGSTVISSPQMSSDSSASRASISSEQPLTTHFTQISSSTPTSTVLSTPTSFFTLLTSRNADAKSSSLSTIPATTGHTVGGTSKSTSPQHAVTDATTIDATVGISDDGGGGGGNKGLIIGLTVGAILLVVLIAALVMFCFCVRMKRKEKVRRNYIQNTNIFYSFPEDASDTEATESDVKYSDNHQNGSLPSYTINANYDSYDNQSTTSTANPLRLDAYKIHKSLAENSNTRPGGGPPEVRDAGHSADMANETMDFVNGTENISESRPGRLDVNMNGGKSVTFDPSSLYSEVRKEGKTKF